MRATLESEPEPVLSRWHAGETSFGGLGRFLLSFGVLCALVAGYPIARGGVLMVADTDLSGPGFMWLYVAFAIPAALFALFKIWKPARIR